MTATIPDAIRCQTCEGSGETHQEPSVDAYFTESTAWGYSVDCDDCNATGRALCWFCGDWTGARAQYTADSLPGVSKPACVRCASYDEMVPEFEDRANARQLLDHLENCIAAFIEPEPSATFLGVQFPTIRKG